MIAIVGTLLLAGGLGPVTRPAVQHPSPEAQDKKPVYDEQANAAKDIAAALAKAQRDHQRVLIQWGANWCGWCVKLNGLLHSDDEIAHELLYEYQLVHVDVGQVDKNLDLVAKYGAGLKDSGIPYLTILDPDGKVVVNQESGVLEEGDHHDQAKVLAFLTKHQPEHVKAADLLAAAKKQAASSKTKLMVTFGAPWCPWCHKLDDWLATPAVADLLSTHLTIQKIDTERSLGGADLLKELRGSDQGGIPWFAFLDPDGKLLATSDGPDGNVGCPYEDAEIAFFCDLLKKVDPTFTSADLQAVHASLAALRKAKAG